MDEAIEKLRIATQLVTRFDLVNAQEQDNDQFKMPGTLQSINITCFCYWSRIRSTSSVR